VRFYISVIRYGVALALVLPAAAAVGQDRPLPDREPFLAEVRKHLQTDLTLQSSYTYVETRRDQKLDKHGRPRSESLKVFENSPGLPGEARWERLIEENGRRVPARKLEEQDRERRKKAQEYARRLTERPSEEHARLERQWDEQRREMAETVADVFRVYDIRMLRREPIDGHDTIAFSLTPQPDAQPRTRDGRIMQHFTAHAWVSESDHELVKLDVEAIETVSIGFGLLARIHKGAALSFLRRKVNGEVWLPARSSYTGSARVGLIAVVRRGGSSEYSNYRKFTVDTAATFK
jgi:hypothetical protein